MGMQSNHIINFQLGSTADKDELGVFADGTRIGLLRYRENLFSIFIRRKRRGYSKILERRGIEYGNAV